MVMCTGSGTASKSDSDRDRENDGDSDGDGDSEMDVHEWQRVMKWLCSQKRGRDSEVHVDACPV